MNDLIYESNIIVMHVACLLIFWQLFGLFAKFCERAFQTFNAKTLTEAVFFWTGFSAFPIVISSYYPSVRIDILVMWAILSVEVTVLVNSYTATAIRHLYLQADAKLGNKWVRFCVFLALIPLFVYLIKRTDAALLIVAIYIVFFTNIEKLASFLKCPKEQRHLILKQQLHISKTGIIILIAIGLIGIGFLYGLKTVLM